MRSQNAGHPQSHCSLVGLPFTCWIEVIRCRRSAGAQLALGFAEPRRGGARSLAIIGACRVWSGSLR